MKRFLAAVLAFTACIFTLSACGAGSVTDNAEQSNAESVDGGVSIAPVYPRDILEGLHYIITCKDKNTKELVDYQFTDDGKLNDGLFRSEDDLENKSNEEMRVDFENTSQYNFVITFETDGTYDAYRLIAHNCDFIFSFLTIEVGADLENMTELEFEEDQESKANMHVDNYADFAVTNVRFIRITITTGTSVNTSFDEISLLGFPMGEADKWLTESVAPEASTSSEGDQDQRFVGTWGADDPEIVEKGGDDYKVVLVFAADGTGSYKQAGFDLPMTWFVYDGVLFMDVAMVGPMTKPYRFENGALYLPDEDGRTTMFVKL